jgi:hypothetical protein
MRVFIGLDVSLAKTAVCVVDRDGVVQWQHRIWITGDEFDFGGPAVAAKAA